MVFPAYAWGPSPSSFFLSRGAGLGLLSLGSEGIFTSKLGNPWQSERVKAHDLLYYCIGWFKIKQEKVQYLLFNLLAELQFLFNSIPLSLLLAPQELQQSQHSVTTLLVLLLLYFPNILLKPLKSNFQRSSGSHIIHILYYSTTTLLYSIFSKYSP